MNGITTPEEFYQALKDGKITPEMANNWVSNLCSEEKQMKFTSEKLHKIMESYYLLGQCENREPQRPYKQMVPRTVTIARHQGYRIIDEKMSQRFSSLISIGGLTSGSRVKCKEHGFLQHFCIRFLLNT